MIERESSCESNTAKNTGSRVKSLPRSHDNSPSLSEYVIERHRAEPRVIKTEGSSRAPAYTNVKCH